LKAGSMRRPRNRQRKVVIDDDLVALFRAAIPHDRAWWQEHMSGKDTLTLEERLAARDAFLAFDMATDRKPWERSLLDPDASGELQAALLAKLTKDEIEAWHAHARKVRKFIDRQHAKYAREYERRVKAAQQRLAGG